MSGEHAISLYLQLTGDIHAYWVAFGALTILVTGWLLTRKAKLGISQRAALTIGWFAGAGYLGSGLMNRYRLVAALSSDVKKIKSDLGMLQVIAELSPIYQHYEVIVWASMAAISVGALLLIWSNVATQPSQSTKSDG